MDREKIKIACKRYLKETVLGLSRFSKRVVTLHQCQQQAKDRKVSSQEQQIAFAIAGNNFYGRKTKRPCMETEQT